MEDNTPADLLLDGDDEKFKSIKHQIMKTKNYALRLAGTIFGIVSVIHLLRLLTDVPIIIADWPVPLWVNVLGLIATAILCAVLWCISLKKDKV